MGNRWIISNHKFRQHTTLKSAEKEYKRLREKCPSDSFSILRVKTSIQPSDAPQTIKALKAALEKYLKASTASEIKSVADVACKLLNRLDEKPKSNPMQAALKAVKGMKP